MGQFIALLLTPFLILNVIAYGFFIYFLACAIRYFAKRKIILGLIGLLVGTTPVWLYLHTKMKVDAEFETRQLEKASWKQKPATEGQQVTSIKVIGASASSFINANIVETATGYEKVLVPDWGNHCVSKISDSIRTTLYGAALARNAFFSCSRENLAELKINPEVYLYVGSRSPNRNQKCGGTAAAELRWSPRKGGELISFKEVPYKRSVSSPLFFPTAESFFLISCNAKRPYLPIDLFTFTANALGFEKVADFPKRASQEDMLEALKILNTENRSYTTAVLMLLGQWPSSPEISEFIRAEIEHDKWTYKILAQLTYDADELDLLPHLESHAADFLEICPKTIRDSRDCATFQKKLNPEF
jgi:hypothetical protein